MALRLTSVPEWTREAVRKVIAAHANVFEDPPQIAVERGELTAEKARVTLPVFTAGVPKRRDDRRAAIAHSKLWLKPKQIAWRTLLETRQGVTVAVELHVSRKKDSFHQLQYGPSIQQTFDALEMARRSRRLSKQEFSVGILQIPALYFSALWVTTNRGRELYFPLVSFPGRLKAKRFYQRKQTVTALVDKWIERREAHKKLAAHKAKSKR
ncbi:MAG TPA: hypothetical protein VMH48_02765 [Methylomirabilota bacterium]|nr:hypothetical protein [Methylomirabilota bacterium]